MAETIFLTFVPVNGAPLRKFWDSVKRFLSDKGTHGNENYLLMENGQLVRDEKKISEIFNDHYINITEKKTGSKRQEESHSVGIYTKYQSEK